jgi:methylated-DNA-[protein]-cysteine S-methyltransferase
MLPDDYFTIPFEMGKVVVRLKPSGMVDSVGFDLEESIEERTSNLKLADDFQSYFSGRKMRFNAVLDLTGTTGFTKKVYERVGRIPYGSLSTYGEIAADVGCRGGARAVGQVMAGNRFPIIVPCHRVIACGNAIGGFSSGLDLKRFLLKLEGVKL